MSKIESESQRREISGYVQLLAGLRFNKQLIYQVFQEGMMRESVIYQDILQKGELKGRQEGRQEGESSISSAVWGAIAGVRRTGAIANLGSVG
ncbi:MAG: hypothetical protein ACFCU8_03850 [Thermosynechococcaceae cyanobacterium]